MGNATKVALVALLILLVVVIARLVRDDSEEDGTFELASDAAAAAGALPAGTARSPERGAPAARPDGRAPAARAATGRPTGATAANSGALEPSQGPRGGTVSSGLSGAAGPGSFRSPSGVLGPRAVAAGDSARTLDARAGELAAGAGSVTSTTSTTGAAPGVTRTLPEPRPLSSEEFRAQNPVAGAGSLPAEATRNPRLAGSQSELERARPIVDTTLKPKETGFATQPGVLTAAAPEGPVASRTPAGEASRDEGRDLSGGVPRATGASRLLEPSGPKDGPKERGSVDPQAPLRGFQQPGSSGPKADRALSDAALATSGGASAQFPQTYVIQEDDSFWEIAERFYGKGTLCAFIERSNPEVKMQPGQKLVILQPPSGASTAGSGSKADLTALNPSSQSSKTPAAGAGGPSGGAAAGIVAAGPGYRVYQVEKGETLWSIAEKFYGDPRKYVRLEEANPEFRQSLRAGAKIKIPDAPAPPRKRGQR